MGPRDSHSAKLFHAVVTLGLAAAGCGGEAQSDGMATNDSGAQANAILDASGASPDAADDASGLDATDTDSSTGNSIDAAVAEDAAADVAEEIWIPQPIR